MERPCAEMETMYGTVKVYGLRKGCIIRETKDPWALKYGLPFEAVDEGEWRSLHSTIEECREAIDERVN